MTNIVQIFDYDGVLFDFRKTWKLFPATRSILEKLTKGLYGKKYIVCLCSKRKENSKYAQDIINVINLNNYGSYFSVIKIHSQSKVKSIQEILEYSIPYK